jgi:hypothetical protein
MRPPSWNIQLNIQPIHVAQSSNIVIFSLLPLSTTNLVLKLAVDPINSWSWVKNWAFIQVEL